MAESSPRTAHRLQLCETCGVALDGHVRKAHALIVLRDGLMVHGATYCVEHAEQITSGYRDARDDVAHAWAATTGDRPELLRYLGVIDAGEGGA